MTESLLRLEEITKTFPGPPVVRVLRGVTLAVDGGQTVAIVGPSGSGKSTLLNIVGMLDIPTSGRYLVRGADAATLTERRRQHLRASLFGFVFQSFHLVPYLDCVSNVMLPLVHQGTPRRQRQDLATTALRRVGLGHRLAAKPTTLSGGEQQRVAIARAIVHEPAIILCDEPTGNLDSDNTANILALLRELVTAERAVIVITHEAEIAARADRVISIRDGFAHEPTKSDQHVA